MVLHEKKKCSTTVHQQVFTLEIGSQCTALQGMDQRSIRKTITKYLLNTQTDASKVFKLVQSKQKQTNPDKINKYYFHYSSPASYCVNMVAKNTLYIVACIITILYTIANSKNHCSRYCSNLKKICYIYPLISIQTHTIFLAQLLSLN